MEVGACVRKQDCQIGLAHKERIERDPAAFWVQQRERERQRGSVSDGATDYVCAATTVKNRGDDLDFDRGLSNCFAQTLCCDVHMSLEIRPAALLKSARLLIRQQAKQQLRQIHARIGASDFRNFSDESVEIRIDELNRLIDSFGREHPTRQRIEKTFSDLPSHGPCNQRRVGGFDRTPDRAFAQARAHQVSNPSRQSIENPRIEPEPLGSIIEAGRPVAREETIARATRDFAKTFFVVPECLPNFLSAERCQSTIGLPG